VFVRPQLALKVLFRAGWMRKGLPVHLNRGCRGGGSYLNDVLLICFHVSYIFFCFFLRLWTVINIFSEIPVSLHQSHIHRCHPHLCPFRLGFQHFGSQACGDMNFYPSDSWIARN
jgi:hypothetical protein